MIRYEAVFDFLTNNIEETIENTAKTIENELGAEAAETYKFIALSAYMMIPVFEEEDNDIKFPMIVPVNGEGINMLNDAGYIEIGGECEEDEYKMLWIMK